MVIKKKSRRVGFVPLIDDTKRVETLQVRDIPESEEPFFPHWERYTGIYHCPECKQVIKNVNVLECEDVMTALIKNRVGAGKDFIDVEQEKAIPDERKIKEEENRLLSKLNINLPESELPVWSGIVNPALYGIRTHADFLNKRQRLVLLYLIDELTTNYSLLAEKDADMAKFVIGALSSLIDQIVDWNCRLSMWIPQNEQVGRGFAVPELQCFSITQRQTKSLGDRQICGIS